MYIKGSVGELERTLQISHERISGQHGNAVLLPFLCTMSPPEGSVGDHSKGKAPTPSGTRDLSDGAYGGSGRKGTFSG